MAAESSYHAGGLMEQGSIDWVALSKTSVSFSVEILARYARAGVEALTVAVGQALFSRVSVPADAQRRLELSVSKLKAFSAVANALWFGIGFKHLIRTMLETEQGAAFVAVSSCLMVSYDQKFSATVLKTLCDKSSMPEMLTPSLSQWGAFLNMCTAAVTASQFPILVEGFSRLLVSNANRREPGRLTATSPGELASALDELAQLSTGKIANVTLMGNADCGWLAALAEWLFSLKVEIVDQTGSSLYQSKGEGRFNTPFFQLTIIRLGDDQSSVPQSLLHSRTHLVPPGDRSFNLRTETPYHLFFQGRSEWSAILNESFSPSFQRLLEPEIIPLFSQVLYSGLYIHKTHPALERMNPWGDYIFTSDSIQHQRRFLSMLRFAAARLPELAALENYGRDHISELDSLDLDRYKLPCGAESGSSRFKKQFGRSEKGIKDKLIIAGFSTALVDACLCDVCNVANEKLPSQVDVLFPDHLCLSKIAIVIFEFIWRLSWLDMDDTIRPSSTGLMSLYSARPLGSAPSIRRRHLSHDVSREAIKLFTGFECPLPFQSPVAAAAAHGLCVYRPSLEHPSLGLMGQFRLRVVPGQIERHDKLYNEVSETMNPWLTHRVDHELDDETASVVIMLGADPLLQLTVEETLNALNIQVVVFPEMNSQVHWNSLYRPKLSSQVQVQYRKSCFLCGPGELLEHIRSCLKPVQCQKTHKSTETHPVWTANNLINPWSGHCSIMDLPWWTHDPGVNGQLLSIPRPNEWVIATLDYTNLNKLRIFRGSSALLYCILARLGTHKENPLLIQSGDCLLCMRSEEDRRFPPEVPFTPQEISVQSLIAGQLQILEFRVCTERAYVNSELPTQTKEETSDKRSS